MPSPSGDNGRALGRGRPRVEPKNPHSLALGMPRRPRTIRAVLFDLGGTLVTERDFGDLAEVAHRVLLDMDPESLAHAYLEVEQEGQQQLLARGSGAAGDPPAGPPEDPVVEFWRQVLSRATGTEVTTEVSHRYCEAVKDLDWPHQLFSDVRRCLETLRHERRLLGIVSNSTSEASVRRILYRTGILEYFRQVVSSGTEGVAKPDAEIFHRAVRRLGVTPSAALYVGNLAFTDAVAAAAAGLHSVWLNRQGTGFGENPPEITSLLEVPLVVRRLETEAGTPEAGRRPGDVGIPAARVK